MYKPLFESHLHFLIKLFAKKPWWAISALYWQCSYSNAPKKKIMPGQGLRSRQPLGVLHKPLSRQLSQHISDQRQWLVKDRASNKPPLLQRVITAQSLVLPQRKRFGGSIQNVSLATSILLWKGPPDRLFLVWGNYLKSSAISSPRHQDTTQRIKVVIASVV